MIHQRDDVLTVSDPHGDVDYVIEPARYSLNLSRVEMIDYHLRRLVAQGDELATGPWAEHVDALLDARDQFSREAS